MSRRRLRLKAHPRLFVSKDTALHLKDKLHSPFLQSQAERVLADADWLVRARPVSETEGGLESAYQPRTRAVASHLQCLTAAWVLSRKAKYRKAALKHLGNLATWNHISCVARHNTPASAELPFCLSYGEHAADIGLMYDLFRPDLTTAEQQVFFDVLNRFCMKEALKCLDNPPWWAFQDWSNWNGVCCGGMGIMALAVYDDMPEAATLIPFVERSLGEYFKSYIRSGGGCHEGTGYWNYGMHYAMRYVLSWESATGREHPAMKIKELGQSLWFPLDFTGITFGDNDGWGPMGFFFMLARRTGHPDAALAAAAKLPDVVPAPPKRRTQLDRLATGDLLFAADDMPTAKQMAKLRADRASKRTPVARVYKGLGWAVLADDSALPALRLSARGGSSRIAGHGHLDLLSFKCMVNGEPMIADQVSGGPRGYGPVAFTVRGQDTYARSAASKSTLFVDGLGCGADTACDATEVVRAKGILGIRIDGSHVYLPRWEHMFIGRLCLMVDNAYWLVIDRVHSANPADGHWMESRFHTFAHSRHGRDWVSLRSGRQRMTMTFASLGEAVMQQSRGMPTMPGPQSTIFRWMSAKGYADNLHATALNPGSRKLRLAIRRGKAGRCVVEVTGAGGYRREIGLTPTWRLRK